jgi:hypothetical protein
MHGGEASISPEINIAIYKKKVEKSGFHKSNYKGILKQLNRRKIEKDVNQWHNVYPRLKNKIKGPSQMVI